MLLSPDLEEALELVVLDALVELVREEGTVLQRLDARRVREHEAERQKQHAEQMFKHVAGAYAVLKDAQKRRQYDLTI